MAGGVAIKTDEHMDLSRGFFLAPAPAGYDRSMGSSDCQQCGRGDKLGCPRDSLQVTSAPPPILDPHSWCLEPQCPHVWIREDQDTSLVAHVISVLAFTPWEMVSPSPSL